LLAKRRKEMGERVKQIFWKVAGPILRKALKEANKGIPEISAHEVHRLLQRGDQVVLVDVREKEELALGYLKDSIFIPRASLLAKAEALLPDKDLPIVVYCAAGARSIMAAKSLKGMGYTNVSSMKEGINGWKDAGYEVASDSELTPDQLTRYSRHLLLNGPHHLLDDLGIQVSPGMEGQDKSLLPPHIDSMAPLSADKREAMFYH
jgi:rhodanese-related sulfurtransferase